MNILRTEDDPILSLSKEEIREIRIALKDRAQELSDRFRWHIHILDIDDKMEALEALGVDEVDVYASKDMKPEGCALEQVAGAMYRSIPDKDSRT